MAAIPTCVGNAQNAPIQPRFEVASAKRSDQLLGQNFIDPGSVALDSFKRMGTTNSLQAQLYLDPESVVAKWPSIIEIYGSAQLY